LYHATDNAELTKQLYLLTQETKAMKKETKDMKMQMETAEKARNAGITF
jgi:hypothetical protein